MADPKITDDAIAELHEHGWCTGALVNEENQHCLMGALQYASTVQLNRHKDPFKSSRDYDSAVRAVEFVLAEYKDYVVDSDDEEEGYNIERWNDEWASGADEVIEVLKLAGERL